MTTRRTFLKSLIGGAAALVLGAEAAQAEAELAVPSTKTIIDLNPQSYLHRDLAWQHATLRRFLIFSTPETEDSWFNPYYHDLQRFQFAKGKDDYHKGELLYYRYAGEPRSRFRMSAATRRKLRRRS
jgi:hypothetical protein